MTVHDYSNFGLFWTHPEGCEIVPPRLAWWQVGRERHNAAPPEDDTPPLTDDDRANECAPYSGVGWSTSKQRYVVQLWFEGRKQSVGSFHTLADALAGHDEFVRAHGLARPLYTRRSA